MLWPPEEQGFWTRENRCFSGAHGHGLSVYIIDTSVDRIEWFLIERETSCILRDIEEDWELSKCRYRAIRIR